MVSALVTDLVARSGPCGVDATVHLLLPLRCGSPSGGEVRHRGRRRTCVDLVVASGVLPLVVRDECCVTVM
ncbi:hypothetical protein C1N91_01815 [Curtobacterium sp. SGAir0471]|nr:hypothetical protein C1N91_01815 [Curtobacterium sp. SGAir0471]